MLPFDIRIVEPSPISYADLPTPEYPWTARLTMG
jgi:hypothetical protein